jgi:hypothetical protein
MIEEVLANGHLISPGLISQQSHYIFNIINNQQNIFDFSVVIYLEYCIMISTQTKLGCPK